MQIALPLSSAHWEWAPQGLLPWAQGPLLPASDVAMQVVPFPTKPDWQVHATVPLVSEQLACWSHPPLSVAQGPVTSGEQLVPFPM